MARVEVVLSEHLEVPEDVRETPSRRIFCKHRTVGLCSSGKLIVSNKALNVLLGKGRHH